MCKFWGKKNSESLELERVACFSWCDVHGQVAEEDQKGNFTWASKQFGVGGRPWSFNILEKTVSSPSTYKRKRHEVVVLA